MYIPPSWGEIKRGSNESKNIPKRASKLCVKPLCPAEAVHLPQGGEKTLEIT